MADEALLRRYLTGELPPEDVERVAAILENDPAAAAKLASLKASDRLLETLRGAAAETSSEDPEIAGIVARADGLLVSGPGTVSEGHSPEESESAASPASEEEKTEQDVRAVLAPAQAPDELGRLGGYRVLRILGRGGMGVVFEAEDTALGRRIALKVMAPSVAANAGARKRFLREARTAATVDHDNVVPIFQVGEDRGVPFLAMPMLRGAALDDRLNKLNGPMPANAVIIIGKQIASGLAAAHAKGLIHRDIKPSNVWLETDESGKLRRAKILDFGLARGIGDDDGLTRPGAILGTPAYMAPEQARGLAVDARADLFSLGCVLYHMATGKRPFTGNDPYAVLTALALDTPKAPVEVNPAIPPALSDLVMKLLVKEPAGRPQTGKDVVEALALIGSAKPAEPQVAIPAAESRTQASSNPWDNIDATPSPAAVSPSPATIDAFPTPAGPDAPRRSRRLLAFGFLGVLAAAIAGVVIIKITTKDGTETVVQVPPGTHAKVKTSDGSEIRVENPPEVIEPEIMPALPPITEAKPEPQSSKVPTPAQRTALEWVVRPRGMSPQYLTLWAATKWVYLESGGQIPSGPLFVRQISMSGIKAGETAVAVEHLTKLPTPDLRFGHSPGINDEFMKHYAASPNTAILEAFVSNTTGLGPAGLAQLARFPKLNSLTLGLAPISAKELEAFRSLPLRHMNLFICKTMTDDAMAVISTFPQLRDLGFAELPLTDKSLEHLAKCKSLEKLSFSRMKFSRPSVQALAAALPNCKITVDGVVILPQGHSPVPPAVAGRSAFDDLDPAKIPAEERMPWLSKHVVGIIGSHKGGKYDPDGKLTLGPDQKHLAMPERLVTSSGVAKGPLPIGNDVLTMYYSSKQQWIARWTVRDGTLHAVDLSVTASPLDIGNALRSPDGRRFAAINPALGVNLYEPGEKEIRLLHGLNLRDGTLRSLAIGWHPDGTKLYTASVDKSILEWDVSEFPATVLRQASFNLSSPAAKLIVAPNGKYLLRGNVIYNFSSPTPVARELPSLNSQKPVMADFLPDSRIVAGYDKNLTAILDPNDFASPGVVISAEAGGLLQLSPDGTRMATLRDQFLTVWDIERRERIASVPLTASLNSTTSFQSQVRWADDSRHLLVAQNGVVYVLRVAEPPRPRMTDDLLQAVDVAKDASKNGQWSRTMSGITGENRDNGKSDYTGLTLPYRVPTEYDLVVECTSSPGDKLRFGVLLPTGKYCNCAIGDRNSMGDFYSYELIDGKPFGTNAAWRPGPARTAGKRITFTIEVRKNGIRTLVDGVEATRIDDISRIAVPGWLQPADLRRPTLTVFGGPIEFHKVTVVNIDGRGEFLRIPQPAASPPIR